MASPAGTTDSIRPFGPVTSWVWDRVLHPLIAPPIEGMEVALIKELLKSTGDEGHLLDVGCGGGETAVAVAEMFSKLKVTGLDLSPDLIHRAKERGRHLKRRIHFVQGSALALPFEPDNFDFVTSFGSLKFWPDPLKGLAECVRVLKPGGQLAVVEADRACKLADTATFVRQSHLPGFVTPVGVAIVRSLAGMSMTVEEARDLAMKLALRDLRVAPIAGTPFLAIQGCKAMPS